MKYFTRGWANGEHDDAECERMRAAYWRRVEELRPGMPAGLAGLATATGLHDALIEKVVWRPGGRRLEMELVCGDNASGYFDLRLVYLDVSLPDLVVGVLAERVRDRRTQILYDEVDREPDGTWVHRLLFWPTGEISISFISLELTRSPRGDRRCNCGSDPFQLI